MSTCDEGDRADAAAIAGRLRRRIAHLRKGTRLDVREIAGSFGTDLGETTGALELLSRDGITVFAEASKTWLAVGSDVRWYSWSARKPRVARSRVATDPMSRRGGRPGLIEYLSQ